MSERSAAPPLGAITESEIRSMPAVWRAVVDRLDEEARELASTLERASSITFVGCGSAYLLSAMTAELLRSTGVAATAAVASDFVLRPEPAAESDPHPVLVAFSRSGATTETRAAVEAFRARSGGTTIAITCRPESGLARQADRAIAIPEADERAVPQTRSVGAFLLLSLLVAARLAGRDILPSVLATADWLEERAEDIWQTLTTYSAARGFVLLGAGVGFPLAGEAALKLTEMGRVPAWAWRALEFRHGPLEMLDDRIVVVGPIGTELDDTEDAAVREAGVRAGRLIDVPALSVDAPLSVLAQLYVLHALALLASRARGRNADAPGQIRAYVDDVHLQIPERQR